MLRVQGKDVSFIKTERKEKKSRWATEKTFNLTHLSLIPSHPNNKTKDFQK